MRIRILNESFPLLKRVFHIDIETCQACGGAVRIIACLEDLVVIKKILNHLREKAEMNALTPFPASRAPPAGMQTGLFD